MVNYMLQEFYFSLKEMEAQRGWVTQLVIDGVQIWTQSKNVYALSRYTVSKVFTNPEIFIPHCALPPPPPSAPGNHQSVFCLYEFACSEYLIWMESCTRGSWLLCWCFSESMLQQRTKDDVFYIADDQYTFFWVKEEEWFPLTDSKVWRELVGRVWEELKLPPGSEGSFFRDRGRVAEAAPLTCCMTNHLTSLGWALYL